MITLPFQSSRPDGVQREGKNRRRTVRSHPHLETLESRVVLSTFRVNTTLDTVAVNLRTGKDATGHVSLRSAIMAADARGGPSTINLRSGTYRLTIDTISKDSAAIGDLDLTGKITIKGAGSRTTV